jgi:hypothetical protein
MRLFLIIALALWHPTDSLADDRELECEKIKQRISRIQSKMRAGYTRAEGEKMEAELRRLRKLRHKACR